MKDIPDTLKYIIVWLLIGTGAVLAMTVYFQSENERLVRKRSIADGGGVVITRKHGHYFLPGKIGGEPVMFLVDTGASTVALSGNLARKLGLKRGANARFNTANGMADGYLSSADIELPGLAKISDHPVSVLEQGSDEVLLGMDILKQFDIQQSGKELTIKPASSKAN